MNKELENIFKPFIFLASKLIEPEKTMVVTMDKLPKKRTLKYRNIFEFFLLFLTIMAVWLLMIIGLDVDKEITNKVCFSLAVLGVIQVLFIKLEREKWWTISIIFIQTGMDMRENHGKESKESK